MRDKKKILNKRRFKPYEMRLNIGKLWKLEKLKKKQLEY